VGEEGQGALVVEERADDESPLLQASPPQQRSLSQLQLFAMNSYWFSLLFFYTSVYLIIVPAKAAEVSGEKKGRCWVSSSSLSASSSSFPLVLFTLGVLVQRSGLHHVVCSRRQHHHRPTRGHAIGFHQWPLCKSFVRERRHDHIEPGWRAQGKRKPYILLSILLTIGGVLWLPYTTELFDLMTSYLILGIGKEKPCMLARAAVPWPSLTRPSCPPHPW